MGGVAGVTGATGAGGVAAGATGGAAATGFGAAAALAIAVAAARTRCTRAVDRRADKALQDPGGLTDAGQHAVVEHDVIEAGRQIVAAQLVPIFRAIDRDDLVLRRVEDVGGQRRM